MGRIERKRSRLQRKPKTFDHGATRIGNVYVLPPTEEDVAAFRRKRRGELTRRALLVGGVAAALGVLSIPFWPRGRSVSVKEVLARLKEAEAAPNLELLKRLCLEYCRASYPAEVRKAAIAFMRAFAGEGDPDIRAALWDRIDRDSAPANRKAALRVLVRYLRDEDVPRLKALYESEPWSRPGIDEAIDLLGFTSLRKALRGR